MAQAYENAILRRNFQMWNCIGQPPVWAPSRQPLVKLVPWFSNMQAGFSHIRPVDASQPPYASGLLVNDFGGNRNYLDTEVIIISINSPDSDARVTERRRAAMVEAIQNRQLMGFIVAKGATSRKRPEASNTGRDILFPGSNLVMTDFECFVLDWFLPVCIWPEAILDGKKRDTKKTKFVWMIKLQKEHLDQQAWWASANHPLPPPLSSRDFTSRSPELQCSICGKRSKVIYNEGFVCFNIECTEGPSHLAGQQLGQDPVLTYTDAFLKERLDPHERAMVGPDPHPQFYTQHQYIQYTPTAQDPWTDNRFKQEVDELLQPMVCPTCRMVSERVQWKGWNCQNKTCHFPVSRPACPPRLDVEITTSLGRNQAPIFRHTNLQQYFSQTYPAYYKGIIETSLFWIHEFELMSTCKVAFMDPKPGTNEMVDGSDHLYLRLQELACTDHRVKLERRQTKRKFVTNHFNQNFGAPYQMNVATDETSFAEAPPEVQKAVDYANDWVTRYRDESDLPFNEMYIAAYLRNQSMSFHQDNERGLTDKILTWSLGGCGVFRISVKGSICLGTKFLRDDGGTDDPLVVGCRHYQERVDLQARLTRNEITKDQWRAQFKQIMADSKSGDGKEVLKFPATHGRLLLMYGKDFQTYYQHKMDVFGPMRFALTFRHIGQENQETGRKRKAESDPVTKLGSSDSDEHEAQDNRDAAEDMGEDGWKDGNDEQDVRGLAKDMEESRGDANDDQDVQNLAEGELRENDNDASDMDLDLDADVDVDIDMDKHDSDPDTEAPRATKRLRTMISSSSSRETRSMQP